MGAKCDTKSIDLSGLPKFKYGNKECIRWKDSVGCLIPFQYGNVHDVIEILKCEYMDTKRSEAILTIRIGKYTPQPITIKAIGLTKCEIGHIVYHKIIDDAPEVIQYLDNPDDAFIYAVGSGQYLNLRCPICGYRKKMQANTLCHQGFSCNQCKDGISYPNKFLASVFTQLNIPFTREVSSRMPGFEWVGNYRYDFLIDIDGRLIFVEVDGGFHRYQYQQDIDKKKDKLALEHNYPIIRIDCNYNTKNRFDYIKERILNSLLRQIIPLNNVNWIECDKYATKELQREVWQMWEDQHLSVGEISKNLDISIWTVINYLNDGKRLGMCPTYKKGESVRRSKHKPILCIKDNQIFAFFDIREANELSLHVLGIQCTYDGIYGVCNQRHRTHRGLQFKYITREEYEQYKMMNDELNLKEVV